MREKEILLKIKVSKPNFLILEREVPLSGSLRDKTMDNKLIYTPNHDKQFNQICKLELFVEKL